MEKQNIKRVLQQTLITISLLTSVSFAQDTDGTSQAHPYLRNGLHGGASLSVVGFIEEKANWEGDGYQLENFVLPKFNLTVGYRFNPYLTIDIQAWSFILLSALEIAPKVNLIDSRISPFITASAGVARAVTLADVSDNEANGFIFSGGVGVDGHISRHFSLYGSLRGISHPSTARDSKGNQNNYVLLMPEAGVQWKF